jgi:CubicO group peptidase (beta-lactamase class C family)
MSDPIEDKYADLDEMQRVMQSAAQAAIAEHHRQGRAVAVWQNGRVVWLGPGGVITEAKPDGSLKSDIPEQTCTEVRLRT